MLDFSFNKLVVSYQLPALDFCASPCHTGSVQPPPLCTRQPAPPEVSQGGL